MLNLEGSPLHMLTDVQLAQLLAQRSEKVPDDHWSCNEILREIETRSQQLQQKIDGLEEKVEDPTCYDEGHEDGYSEGYNAALEDMSDALRNLS